jgi:ABC-type amino acid transport substrate-binding protein
MREDMSSSQVIRLGLASALACEVMLAAAPAPPAAAGVLDKLRADAPLQLGYRIDARPFSYQDESGRPAGYSVALCERLLDALKAEPGLAAVTANWVPIPAGERFNVLERGQIHVFCGADSITDERKNQVAFSIPIFPGGIGALVRSDASSRLREVLLTGGKETSQATRDAAVQTLLLRAFTAVTKTTSEAWLRSRIKDFGVSAFVLPVETFDAGVGQLLDNKTDAFFAERAMLLETVRRHAPGRQLAVIDRFFTQESLALSLPRGDDAWRQFADRTLGKVYSSGDVHELHAKWFGPPDDLTREFFRANTPSQ